MSWVTWPFRVGGFLLWFAGQVVLSNAKVIRDNLTRGQDSTPGVVALDTRCRTDAELTWLGALITLTPGTLTLGTATQADSDAPRRLYIHGMYHREATSLRVELRTIEDRMLRALRRKGGTA